MFNLDKLDDINSLNTKPSVLQNGPQTENCWSVHVKVEADSHCFGTNKSIILIPDVKYHVGKFN